MIARSPTQDPLSNRQGDGFASRRYLDSQGKAAVRLLPNEYFVTDEDLVLTTVLGSCVSACLRDPVVGVAGMNHFMLPVASPAADAASAAKLRYGAHAMDVLVAALTARGARVDRLEAKVFGGGQVFGDWLDDNWSPGRVGPANAEFVLDYLARAGIRVLAQDLGDRHPRQLRYFAATGEARVRRLAGAHEALMGTRVDQERAPARQRIVPVGHAVGGCG